MVMQNWYQILVQMLAHYKEGPSARVAEDTNQQTLASMSVTAQ